MPNANYSVPVPTNEPILGYTKGSPEKTALKASLKYDLKFAEKLNKVCEYHGIDKSKVFRALVELEFTRIEKFKELFDKKQKKS